MIAADSCLMLDYVRFINFLLLLSLLVLTKFRAVGPTLAKNAGYGRLKSGRSQIDKPL